MIAPVNDIEVATEENDATDGTANLLKEIEDASEHLAGRVLEVIGAIAVEDTRRSSEDLYDEFDTESGRISAESDNLTGRFAEDFTSSASEDYTGKASEDIEGVEEDTESPEECLVEDEMSKMKVTKYISQLAATTKLRGGLLY